MMFILQCNKEVKIFKDNQQMDNLKKIYPLSNWVNKQTEDFLSSLSFYGYVLAGSCVANMVQEIPLQGDLDFWTYEQFTYMNALQEIGQFYEQFYLYPSMIEMKNKNSNLPKANLIFTNVSALQIIQQLDMDYCRCYWTRQHGVVYAEGCIESIKTKIVKKPKSYIKVPRILEAIKHNYVFQKRFWSSRSYLIANQRLKLFPQTPNNGTPYPIRIQDLSMQKFLFRRIKLKVKDKYNVPQTLAQLSKKLGQLSGRRNTKLRVLLKFKRIDLQLLRKYTYQIILNNPLSYSRSILLDIGKYRISYKNSDDLQYQSNNQSQMSSEQEQIQIQKQKIGSQNHLLDSKGKKNKNNYQRTGYTKIFICEKISSKTVILDQQASAYVKLEYLSLDMIKFTLQCFDQMWYYKCKNKYLMYRQRPMINQFYNPKITDKVKLNQMYSGYSNKLIQQSQIVKDIDELSDCFKRIYRYVTAKEEIYNEMIVNWQRDGQDFFFPEYNSRNNVKTSRVCMLSIYSSEDYNGYRYFQIKPKLNTKSLENKFCFRLDHGLLLTTMGKTQKLYDCTLRNQHRETLSRINIIFRHV